MLVSGCAVCSVVLCVVRCVSIPEACCLLEQQVATYMLGNLDGEEKEGGMTATQLRCLSAWLAHSLAPTHTHTPVQSSRVSPSGALSVCVGVCSCECVEARAGLAVKTGQQTAV